MSLIMLPSIKVMYTTAEEPTGGIPGAWDRLESSLPSLKGRKFYGTFQFPEGPYRACVAVTDEDTGQLPTLERWTIPGGEFAQLKLAHWEQNPSKIRVGFAELAGRHAPDRTRPSIEFYRRQNEVVLYLPVLGTNQDRV